MQGLTGVGNKIYFIKLKRNGGETKSAKICTCTIKEKDGKCFIDAIERLPGGRHLGHANSMVAIKKDGKTQLYIAPCVDYCKKVYNISINEDGLLAKRTKTIPILESTLANKKEMFKSNSIKKINSIASWKHNHKQFFIMNCTENKIKNAKKNYVFEKTANGFKRRYIFKTPINYKQKGHTAAQQGALVSNNKYYLVVSHGKRIDLDYYGYRNIWNESYVFRFVLKINKKNNIIVKSDASFRFYSGKKVRVRPGCGKRAEKKRRFEMEEL